MAFIWSCHIHDFILMVSERINLLNHKVYSCSLGLKIDIPEAFDTLNWNF